MPIATLEIPNLTEAKREKFWSRVEIKGPDECWPWTGCVNEHGYGIVRLHGAAWKNYKTSRIAYFLTNGPFPEGKPNALHKCDTPRCCNPAHIFAGSQKDNGQDMARKGRSTLGDRNPARLYPEKVVRGEKAPWSKLTEAKVIDAKRRYAAGEKQASIARDFGVHQSAISDVITGRKWKHLMNNTPTGGALNSAALQ